MLPRLVFAHQKLCWPENFSCCVVSGSTEKFCLVSCCAHPHQIFILPVTGTSNAFQQLQQRNEVQNFLFLFVFCLLRHMRFENLFQEFVCCPLQNEKPEPERNLTCDSCFAWQMMDNWNIIFWRASYSWEKAGCIIFWRCLFCWSTFSRFVSG